MIFQHWIDKFRIISFLQQVQQIEINLFLFFFYIQIAYKKVVVEITFL